MISKKTFVLVTVILVLTTMLANVNRAYAVYVQDWESGTGGWSSSIVLVTDAEAPSPTTVQRITRCATGGDYYSPLIAVTPGETYRIGVWIKWVSGGWPFIGINQYTLTPNYRWENWLIGQAGYPTGLGDTVTPVPIIDGWYRYEKTVTIAQGTGYIRLKNELWCSASRGGSHLGYFDDITVLERIQEVDIDIKPGSYPNALNSDGHGVIPVAILGSADLDVTEIDVSTLSFAGLEVRVKGKGTPQCSVEDVSGDFSEGPEGAPDGYPDLVCQFVDDPEAWAPSDSVATITGTLNDGTPIEGSDEITIVPAK